MERKDKTKYALRLKHRNICIQAAAPTAEPPKPANQTAPLNDPL